MDISEIAAQARGYRRRIESARASVKEPIQWYPYLSLANFDHLDRLLTGPRRSLLDLTAGGPVLDIGCADGETAFFLESLGCAVHAVDHPIPNHNGMAGIRALKRVLGSNVEIHVADLDEQFRLPGTGYGLALFLGILYHLRNPFYVLEQLSRHARYCLLSTRVARCAPGGAWIQDQPVAYLLDRDELNGDNTNYWIFSEAGLRRLLKRTNWEVLDWMTSGARNDSDPVNRDERAFCLLRSSHGLRNVTLNEGWHAPEGDGWRWTERRFSMTVGARDGFEMRVYVPAALLERFGTVQLFARAGGEELAAETWDSAGEHLYGRRLSGADGEQVRLDFCVSAALEPDEADRRERGIIVSSVEVK